MATINLLSLTYDLETFDSFDLTDHTALVEFPRRILRFDNGATCGFSTLAPPA